MLKSVQTCQHACACSPPHPLGLQEAEHRAGVVGTEAAHPCVLCPKPPLCSVPEMSGDVGLKMDPDGRRLPMSAAGGGGSGQGSMGQAGGWGGKGRARSGGAWPSRRGQEH